MIVWMMRAGKTSRFYYRAMPRCWESSQENQPSGGDSELHSRTEGCYWGAAVFRGGAPDRPGVQRHPALRHPALRNCDC